MISGRLVRGAAGWVVAVVVAGCGGKATGGPGGGTPTPAPASSADFPKALAHAICVNVRGCCVSKKLPVVEASCEMALTTIYERRGTAPSPYDQSTGQTCLDAVTSATAACDFTSGSAITAACSGLNGIAATHAKVGEPCNATCTEESGSSSCVSESLPLGQLGAVQAEGSCFTNEGIHCDFAAGMCAAQVDLGNACTSSDQCKSGLCGPASVCVAKSKRGEDCSFDPEACADGLYCDGTSCAPVRAIGAPCNDSSDCASHSCSNGVCADQSDAVLELTCVQ